jgi:hypothetical protein
MRFVDSSRRWSSAFRGVFRCVERAQEADFYARSSIADNWRSRKVRNTRRVREVSRIVAVSPVHHDLATADMEHVDGLISSTRLPIGASPWNSPKWIPAY